MTSQPKVEHGESPKRRAIPKAEHSESPKRRSSRRSSTACRQKVKKRVQADELNRLGVSSRPPRIDNAIRVGRRESTKRFKSAALSRHRFESAAANRQSGSGRPTRVIRLKKAIRAGLPESPKRFAPIDPNRRSDSIRPAQIADAIRVGLSDSTKRFD